MHEFSLAEALMRQLTDLANEYPGQKPIAARVQIGEFSGVEPELLSSAFNELASRSPYHELDLFVERTLLQASCNDCANEFRVLRFNFVCPNCGSPKVRVVGGEEMLLESIILEDLSA